MPFIFLSMNKQRKGLPGKEMGRLPQTSDFKQPRLGAKGSLGMVRMRAFIAIMIVGLREPHQYPATGAVSQLIHLQPSLGTASMLEKVGICQSEISKSLVRPVEKGTIPCVEPKAATSDTEKQTEW